MEAASDLSSLLERRAEFKAFVASRLGNPSEAEDLLQNSLLKALRSAEQVRDEEKLVPWFYRLLRNAVVDHVRARSAGRVREEEWLHHNLPDQPTERALCSCLAGLIAALPQTQAKLVAAVELEQTRVDEAARTLGLSANNASVILHRARKELRKKLEQLCGDCAEGACLDCDCGEVEKP